MRRDDYKTTCEAIGKYPQNTFNGNFNIRIPAELHKEASILASQKHMSLNDLVKVAIAFAVKHENLFSDDEFVQG